MLLAGSHRVASILQSTGLGCVAVALLLLGSRASAADDALAALGPAGPIEKVAGDFAFVEGPADDGQGNLYFTDIPNQRIHRLAADGQLTVFAENSRHTNGLMFTPAGKLLACEMDGALVEWDVAGPTRRVLVDKYDGTRFNACNDLVLDSAGGIYFTDPHYNAPRPLPQTVQGVYYLAPDGTVTRVVDDLPAPNGILLSKDEQTLFVAPTESMGVLAYPIEAPGKLGDGRDFCQLHARGNRDIVGCDGCTMDEHGNLYVTTELGVQVVSPQGEWLGVIETPEQPANCTFGGPDGTTLYVTARTSLYAVPMRVKGHRYGNNKSAD
ncbi:MAG: SMP-30/gluconolactonase/LRE family protein [Planctomycetales bacterium]|nr:SMP-30/gluconolactonase/LRE family protein [Planctomycetales bacterium]